jgi:hypothetical protein
MLDEQLQFRLCGFTERDFHGYMNIAKRYQPETP